jgi:hypothetical protein
MPDAESVTRAKRLAQALDRSVYLVMHENAWKILNYTPQANYRGIVVEVAA